MARWSPYLHGYWVSSLIHLRRHRHLWDSKWTRLATCPGPNPALAQYQLWLAPAPLWCLKNNLYRNIGAWINKGKIKIPYVKRNVLYQKAWQKVYDSLFHNQKEKDKEANNLTREKQRRVRIPLAWNGQSLNPAYGQISLLASQLSQCLCWVHPLFNTHLSSSGSPGVVEPTLAQD